MTQILADLTDWATKAGSFPMQVLLLIAIVTLGTWLRIMHKQNQATTKDFIDRLDAKETAMSKERNDRITMLMALVREDVEAKVALKAAVEANSRTISDLKDFMATQTSMLRVVIENNQQNRPV